ncbi:MAG TPA: hypothetical protein ENI68_02070 [Gammaproteobacteria bacterium]|nr:hypothetical protein [Gammaproteobacteria bacterium]
MCAQAASYFRSLSILEVRFFYARKNKKEVVIEIRNYNGQKIYLVDGLEIKENGELVEVKFGLLASDLKKYAQRGQASAIAQFYMLVVPGLILTRHIFRGLERPLYCDGDMDADGSKLVYSRAPTLDYEWAGGAQGEPVRHGEFRGQYTYF